MKLSALLALSLPTLLYRCPGTHHCAGGTYDYIPAASPEILESLLGQGWFMSLPEAIKGEHDEIEDDTADEDLAPELDVELTTQESPEQPPATDEEPPAGESKDQAEESTTAGAEDAAQPSGEQHSASDASEPDDDAAPTREELEAKANELGIKFDGRTTDKVLAEKIEFIINARAE